MPKGDTEQFEEIIKLYLLTLENYCLDRINAAKDKPYVKGKMANQINAILFAYSSGFQAHLDSHLYFLDQYKIGVPISEILTGIKSQFPKSLDIEPILGLRDEVTFVPFSEPEEKLLETYPNDLQKFVRMHAGNFALQEVAKRIPTYLTEDKDLKNRSAISYPFHWTGTKDNKNEFVQLIYGLYKAKLLNNGEGEITKIVESLAQIFKVDLSPNWQANLSASIHKSNNGYNPQVFDKINKAYQEYVKALIEHKKQNR